MVLCGFSISSCLQDINASPLDFEAPCSDWWVKKKPRRVVPSNICGGWGPCQEGSGPGCWSYFCTVGIPRAWPMYLPLPPLANSFLSIVSLSLSRPLGESQASRKAFLIEKTLRPLFAEKSAIPDFEHQESSRLQLTRVPVLFLWL